VQWFFIVILFGQEPVVITALKEASTLYKNHLDVLIVLAETLQGYRHQSQQYRGFPHKAA
jgi:hypothetical protein